ncbi:response regulator [Aetokthonos hydrillicola Thurmond2011]|jgi:CheY-like chemotaxis protein|uniref:Response regulator n=1 Tax=Aetokthonos hydrillicola Thurmond2011 TaxID=2712845 RepID=A0AAP5ME57_9CYAN|nr:response regulator [Aetokthonos hydrillicola]MBO3463898.1 response regulator [Aetokthonos hydrillicola CCALA 1050]MBW4589976.1 response regulator [Aetokthonos hydrillicola CCALA 1050]MDR9900558.1 response regulator [Aetokthonos hydrillicola Thurmond2011]
MAQTSSLEGSDQLSSSQASSQILTTTLLTGIRILLVDDDPDNLDLLRFLLEQNGAIVTSATSAVKALEIIVIPGNFPDLIISDIGMQGMNGYEFIQQVGALPQGQQVLALAFTAFARQENQEQALRSGFQAYIPYSALHNVLPPFLRIIPNNGQTVKY